ncbi:MAG TPA: hypothetical protein VLH09_09145 [Bryobacteraceae bacterium]|nr:hypothetical protein [Bryobacteraceae bacterium]
MADAEYRRMMQAREDAALSRWRALSGSAASYRALYAGTEALLPDDGWDPIERVTEEERAANG